MSSFLTPEEAEVREKATLKVSSEEPAAQITDEDAAKRAQPDRVIPLTDDYVLISEVGHGGFGTVYKAKHKKIDKTVALKVINSDLITDVTAVKRFEQEASGASNLTHANIAAVYDHGRTASGASFLVMDFIDGKSLSSILIEKGRIEPKHAVDILIQLCDALEHAHQKGVIHRDIKPNNIILSGANQDLVKLIDFGIAKVSTAPKMDVNRITQTAQILGSPAYMSPEQCLGSKLDPRSDIYSLGCVMYEMLIGKPPFLGDNPVQTVVKQINDQPAPLALKTTDRTFNELASLTMECLRKQPDDRVQTMRKLGAALRRVKSGKSVIPFKAPNLLTCGLVAALALTLLAIARFSEPPPHIVQPIPVVVKDEIIAKPGEPITIVDVHNKVLYRSASAHDLGEAFAEAVRRKIDLPGANLSHANLASDKYMQSGTLSVKGLNLAGADFTGSTLGACSFTGCNLSQAVFKGTDLDQYGHLVSGKKVLFDQCDLTDAHFVGIASVARGFKSTNFNGATLEGMSMDYGEFDDCNFSNASFTNSQLGYVSFKNCNLTNARLRGSRLWKSAFPQCTLVHTDFTKSDLLGVKLQYASKIENLVLKSARNVPTIHPGSMI